MSVTPPADDDEKVAREIAEKNLSVLPLMAHILTALRAAREDQREELEKMESAMREALHKFGQEHQRALKAEAEAEKMRAVVDIADGVIVARNVGNGVLHDTRLNDLERALAALSGR